MRRINIRGINKGVWRTVRQPPAGKYANMICSQSTYTVQYFGAKYILQSMPSSRVVYCSSTEGSISGWRNVKVDII
jgi:hypothetical protein